MSRLPSLQRAIDAYIHQEPEDGMPRVWMTCRVAVVLLGAIRAYASRYQNNPAGIAYLDIGDAYMRGDFADAINGYWSPLYSLLLGPVVRLVHPGPAIEAPLAHLVNFLIFVATMVAFEYYLRTVMSALPAERRLVIPTWAWITLGYASFAWSTLMLIGLADLSADVLMALFVYLAAAVVVQAHDRAVTTTTGVGLGISLGLGYLAKAAMFPLAFVFFIVAGIDARVSRRNGPALVVAVLVFALVASPFVIALSLQKGRVTTGDVGKLVYAWFVNDVRKYAHWQGEAPGRGVPVHPDRKLQDHPEVFEYATPVAGTHPPFYDPSYWYEGLQTHIDPRKQIWALLMAGKEYWQIVIDSSAEWLALGVLLVWGVRKPVAALAQQWYILVPALAPFAMFAILHTETRFVGAFLVMAITALLRTIRIPDAIESRRIASLLLVGLVIAVSARVVVATVDDTLGRARGSNRDADVADGLRALGVAPGDHIGMIGNAYDAYWARLLRARFVVELPQTDVADFWSDTPVRRQQTYDTFRRAGARWIMTEWVPRTEAAQGWQNVGATGVYVLRLPAPGKEVSINR